MTSPDACDEDVAAILGLPLRAVSPTRSSSVRRRSHSRTVAAIIIVTAWSALAGQWPQSGPIDDSSSAQPEQPSSNPRADVLLQGPAATARAWQPGRLLETHVQGGLTASEALPRESAHGAPDRRAPAQTKSAPLQVAGGSDRKSHRRSSSSFSPVRPRSQLAEADVEHTAPAQKSSQAGKDSESVVTRERLQALEAIRLLRQR